MSGKYTPGPWKVGDHIEAASIGLHPHHVWPVESGDTGVAACILPHEDATEETENTVQANARLISAAPEMAETLKALRDVLVEFGAPFKYWSPEQQDLFRKSGAALQKAGVL